MTSPLTPFTELLHDDVLCVVAGYLVSPYDFYALVRVDRRCFNLLLCLSPALVRRMTVTYFTPFLHALLASQGLRFAPVRTPELLRMSIERWPWQVAELARREITEELAFVALERTDERKVFYMNTLQSHTGAENYAKAIFEKVPMALRSERVCKLAVQLHWKLYTGCPLALKADPAFRLHAVTCHGFALEFIQKNQTPELVEAAVRSRASAIQYVRKHLLTQHLCDLAVEQDACAIRYIPAEFQSPAMCRSAVSRKKYLIQHVNLQTPELCEQVITADWTMLQHVQRQTPDLCDLALQKNWRAFHHIREPTLKQLIVRQKGFLEEYPVGTAFSMLDEYGRKRVPDHLWNQLPDELRVVPQTLNFFSHIPERPRPSYVRTAPGFVSPLDFYTKK